MTCTVESNIQPAEFTSVIKLVNCYIATYVTRNKIEFISNHPESDIKIAQATAQSFSTTQNIPYDNSLRRLSKPIITVLKRGQNWFPAELHADRINFLQTDSDKTQRTVTALAYTIALNRNLACVPSIGISLTKK